MAKKEKEKTVKIGKFKVKTSNLCMFALVAILGISFLGTFSASRFGNPDQNLDQSSLTQVSVLIDFGNNTQYNKIVSLTEGGKAEQAFKEVADVTTFYTDIGTYEIYTITSGNISKTIDDDHLWIFYVNGNIMFTEIDKYTPKHGDTLALRYEQNPY